ncbi:MAG: hypothetical protein JRD05_00115 [Deltaproteobacteria bacterium]|nr:hypothetical protein [Deltaproteobacteria bacterium]
MKKSRSKKKRNLIKNSKDRRKKFRTRLLIKENLAQKRFISVSAVVPNISADDEWIKKFQDIKDKFDQLLGVEKARIAG